MERLRLGNYVTLKPSIVGKSLNAHTRAAWRSSSVIVLPWSRSSCACASDGASWTVPLLIGAGPSEGGGTAAAFAQGTPRAARAACCSGMSLSHLDFAHVVAGGGPPVL